MFINDLPYQRLVPLHLGNRIVEAPRLPGAPTIHATCLSAWARCRWGDRAAVKTRWGFYWFISNQYDMLEIASFPSGCWSFFGYETLVWEGEEVITHDIGRRSACPTHCHPSRFATVDLRFQRGWKRWDDLSGQFMSVLKGIKMGKQLALKQLVAMKPATFRYSHFGSGTAVHRCIEVFRRQRPSSDAHSRGSACRGVQSLLRSSPVGSNMF